MYLCPNDIMPERNTKNKKFALKVMCPRASARPQTTKREVSSTDEMFLASLSYGSSAEIFS